MDDHAIADFHRRVLVSDTIFRVLIYGCLLLAIEDDWPRPAFAAELQPYIWASIAFGLDLLRDCMTAVLANTLIGWELWEILSWIGIFALALFNWSLIFNEIEYGWELVGGIIISCVFLGCYNVYLLGPPLNDVLDEPYLVHHSVFVPRVQKLLFGSVAIGIYVLIKNGIPSETEAIPWFFIAYTPASILRLITSELYLCDQDEITDRLSRYLSMEHFMELVVGLFESALWIMVIARIDDNHDEPIVIVGLVFVTLFLALVKYSVSWIPCLSIRRGSQEPARKREVVGSSIQVI